MGDGENEKGIQEGEWVLSASGREVFDRGLGAVARAESLLAPAPRPGVTAPAFVMTGLALAVTIASAVFQLHHAAMFGATLLS